MMSGLTATEEVGGGVSYDRHRMLPLGAVTRPSDRNRTAAVDAAATTAALLGDVARNAFIEMQRGLWGWRL